MAPGLLVPPSASAGLVGAGLAGASSAAFGKLAGQQQWLPGKLACYALLVACNALMLGLYTRGLRAMPSLRATVIAAGCNMPAFPPGPLFNYKVVLSYDGTGYGGFQLQLGSGRATIQEKLEAALAKLTKEPREVLKVQGAGRTDAGVHARGQVAQFLTRAPLDCATTLRALNALLPKDTYCTSVQRVPLDFNVRYALRKTYHYDVHTQPVADPFTIRYRHHPRHAERLDVEAVRSAAQLFVGTHNFAAFSNVPRDGRGKNPVKTIYRFDVEGLEGGIRLAVEGSGFLYKQVRHMVGALLAVGFGRLDPARIEQLLSEGGAASPKGRAGNFRGWNVAEAKGLCLHSVVYPPHEDPERPMEYGQQAGGLESDQD